MTWYSASQLSAIAAHMNGDLSVTSVEDRGERIKAWVESLEGDQQAWVVGIALEQQLVFLDAVGELDLAFRQYLDQMITDGVHNVGPLPLDFTPPTAFPDL